MQYIGNFTITIHNLYLIRRVQYVRKLVQCAVPDYNFIQLTKLHNTIWSILSILSLFFEFLMSIISILQIRSSLDKGRHAPWYSYHKFNNSINCFTKSPHWMRRVSFLSDSCFLVTSSMLPPCLNLRQFVPANGNSHQPIPFVHSCILTLAMVISIPVTGKHPSGFETAHFLLLYLTPTRTAPPTFYVASFSCPSIL